ncbi:MAG: FHIPEP family type III secretion protein [Nibricoccus sp.]
MTLFRLALNICPRARFSPKATPASMIESFGHFVIQGNYIVGFVVFIILDRHQLRGHHEGCRPYR